MNGVQVRHSFAPKEFFYLQSSTIIRMSHKRVTDESGVGSKEVIEFSVKKVNGQDVQDDIFIEGSEERGMLGMLFHPVVSSNGQFFAIISSSDEVDMRNNERFGTKEYCSLHVQVYKIKSENIEAHEVISTEISEPEENNNLRL